MEKHRAIQRQIHSVVINQDELTDQDKKISRYFLFISLYYRVKFSFKQTCFWDEVKKPILGPIHKTFLNQELSTSQKQAKRTKIRDSLRTGGRYHCLIQI